MSKHLDHSNVELFFEGDPYYRKVLEILSAAKNSIYFESYIFDYDPVGIEVLRALKTASENGCKVNLLVDGIGSFNSLTQLRNFSRGHFPMRIYHPLPAYDRMFKSFSWKWIRRLLIFFRRINKRNHRKMIIVDEKHVFIGSFNISQVHSKKWLGKIAWRDTAVYIPELSEAKTNYLKAAFLKAWKNPIRLRRTKLGAYLKDRIRPPPNAEVRLNTNLAERFFYRRELNKRLRKCTERILITNPYFVPHRSTLKRLIQAAKRGVNVEIILPADSDVKIVKWASSHLYAKLLKNGIKIHEYQNRFIHAKTIIIDNWIMLGSHNLNYRSFVHDLEIDFISEDENVLKQMLEQWNVDLANCVNIMKSNFSLRERLLFRACYFLRYWL